MAEASTPASPSSIPLYLINGVATVWDAQVAATLHCVHGISGLRVGTLPGVASQNGFLGLPITLMQEETAYLVRQGIAHLVPVSTEPTRRLPSSSQVERYNAERLSRIRKLEAAARAQEQEKAQTAKMRFAEAGAAAQAKREARARIRAQKVAAKAEVEGEGEGGSAELFGNVAEGPIVKEAKPESRESETPLVPISDEPTPLRGTHFHTVAPHPVFPDLAYLEPITSIPHPLFEFPATPRDRALLDTFTRLLRLNLRIGLGPRFGGEYLVYPGDYLRYHAHFTSQVLVRDEVIRPAEIVAWGRLGTGTKKSGLLCCWDDSETGVEGAEEGKAEIEGQVDFYSLEWANFG